MAKMEDGDGKGDDDDDDDDYDDDDEYAGQILFRAEAVEGQGTAVERQ